MSEHDGFIEIGDGLWYCERDGSPWSTKRNLGRGNGWSTDGELKRLTGKNNGYYYFRYNGKMCLWHRVVFQHFNGYLPLPPMSVDHEDKNRENNLISNLREASRSQQEYNKDKLNNCSSKYKGVNWHKRDNKWRAYITINGKVKHLGYYTDEEDAARAYDKAAREHHGEFANPNFPE